MTENIIITLCLLVLLAYVFDLTSSKTKVPSVILLLALGWVLSEITVYFEMDVPKLSSVLPVLGTIGLIMIVLEGSLELELNRSKSRLIAKSFFTGLLPMLVLALGFAFVFQYYDGSGFRVSLLNAIPLCVISSAIAIPSVRNMSAHTREFVVYESSISDILGVLLFNFIALNTHFGAFAFGGFFLQLIVIALVSFAATIGLALLLSKVTHHIKFIPIILLIVLIYAISKIYHLPSLVFILFFGLFIGNIDEMKGFRWIEKLQPDVLNVEVHKLKDLIVEGAFLIRSVFFLLFGYLIDTEELLNVETALWALGITAAIFAIRAIHLKIFRLPLLPLLFIAPRGLITILLFLSVSPTETVPLVNRSLVIQVIVMTALLMMVGMMKSPAVEEAENEKRESEI